MDKFKNLKDSLREGDMFKSENGNIGIKLYGKFYFSNPIGYEDSNCVRDLLKEQYTNIIEYNPSASLEYNNKKLVEADLHVIVPPYDFYITHIIGAGLYTQIIERRKAGKNSEVFVNGALFPIEKIYQLAGNDLNKTAVIVY